MAPEQGVPGGGVDERTDVHALGAVAYHMLTGRPMRDMPMRDMAVADVAAAGTPAPPHQVADVTPALSDVVLRAVRPDPADRWPSAAAFSAALRSATGTGFESPAGTWIAGAPSVSPPAAPAGRSRRLAIGALLAAIAVVAATGLVLLTLRDDDPAGDDRPASVSPHSETPSSSEPTGTGPSSAPTTPLGQNVAPADRPFCTSVQDLAATLQLLDGDNATGKQLKSMIDAIHEAASNAPSQPTEVAVAWRLYDKPFADLRRAVDRTGIPWADVGSEYDGAHGAELADALRTFAADVNALSDRVGEVIAADLQERCGLDSEDLELKT